MDGSRGSRSPRGEGHLGERRYRGVPRVSETTELDFIRAPWLVGRAGAGGYVALLSKDPPLD